MKDSYLSACRAYFGQKDTSEGKQSIAEFAGEMKELDPRDRMDVAYGLHAEGVLSDVGLAKETDAEPDMGPRPGYGA